MTAHAQTESTMKSPTNGHTAVASRPRAKNGHASGGATARLRRIERLFGDFDWPQRATYAEARKRARAHALDVLEGAESEQERVTALLVAAAELFRSLSDPRAQVPNGSRDVAGELEQLIGVSRLELVREVLRAPELMTRPPDAACRFVLATLVSMGPLRSASLWSIDPAERTGCVCHVGDGRPSRGARQLARQLLGGEEAQAGTRRLLVGLAVGQREPAAAALVGCADPGMRERARAMLGEATAMLAALVERDALLAANAESERALLEASERKLTRLGFDLHDGPIQDVAVLAEDLRLFRDQLEGVLGPLAKRKLLRGRIEDLDAQLVALDGELRRLSGEVQAASVLLNRPFRSALGDRVRAFSARTGIKPTVAVSGDTDMLSTSQQIALLNIVQEALSNIREHAQASAVQIRVSVDHDGVHAKVADDGRGFELEPTLMRAAREGRIGLLAMNERVRLLGGKCRIDSRSGGPTTVSIALRRWLPLHAGARPGSASA
jgi:signal transduction histidine kinase